jgi:hypothetical protein
MVFLGIYVLAVSLPICPDGPPRAEETSGLDGVAPSQEANAESEMSVSVCLCIKASWSVTGTGIAQIPSRSPIIRSVALPSLAVYARHYDGDTRFLDPPDVVPKIDSFFS